MPIILDNNQINLLSNRIIDILSSKKERVTSSVTKSRHSWLKRKVAVPISTKLPKKYKDLIIEVLEKTLQKATLANLSPEIAEYEKFSEAIGSGHVGKLNFRGCLVIKAGEDVEKIKKQADYIVYINERLKPEFGKLFPEIIDTSDKNGIAVCLMGFLETYISLHEMVFGKRYSDWQINNSIDKVLDLVRKIYIKEIDRKNIPKASELYQRLRIEETISKGRERDKEGKIEIRASWKSFFTNGIESLFTSKIVIDGQLFEPITYYTDLISKKIDKFSPDFVTWIHGDLHPGNIMVNLNVAGCEIKFIDPNPDFEKGSDYLYDMGKLLHWLDMMGFVVREIETKELNNNEIVKLDIKEDNDVICISYIIDEEYSDLRGHFFDYAFRKITDLGENTFSDTNLLPRLYLSVASAYLGGLKYFTDFKHVIISYTQGLKYLVKALSLN